VESGKPREAGEGGDLADRVTAPGFPGEGSPGAGEASGTLHYSPGSRDYNIEGTPELTLEAHTADRLETTGRMLSLVAGARSDRLHTGPRRLAVQMQF
jgi:hypothetical protein